MKTVWEVYNGQIKELRNQGLTLQAIGDKVGVTRERIRQILEEHYGTTAVSLISRMRLAKIIGCTDYALIKLEKQGRVKPIHVGRHYLYNRNMAEEVMLALQKQCKHCGKPMPLRLSLRKYCPSCSIKRKKYVYPFLSEEGKRKHCEKTKKWRREHPERWKELSKKAMGSYYARKRKATL